MEGNGADYWLYSDDANCKPTITNCVFRGSVEKSVRVGPEFQMSGNSFTGSSNLGTEVIGGNISSARTWEKQEGDSIYIIVMSDLKIRGGGVLTINPGVAIKFSVGTGMIIGFDEWSCDGAGALLANGEDDNWIIFTGVSVGSGTWKGLLFDADSDCSGLKSFLRYCVIDKAGEPNYRDVSANIHCYHTNTPLISHCCIDSSAMYGLYLENTSLVDTMRCTLIRNNAMDGIYIASASNIVLGIDPDSANCIFGNGYYGLENRSTNRIIAINNYWDTEDSIEIEEAIFDSLDSPGYGRVVFSPWSDTCLWSLGVLEQNVLCPCKYNVSIYPNPFNTACRISAPENAIIEIFDINGRSVAEFGGGEQIWKPEASVGSGVYLVRAKIGDKDITKRVVYLK